MSGRRFLEDGGVADRYERMEEELAANRTLFALCEQALKDEQELSASLRSRLEYAERERRDALRKLYSAREWVSFAIERFAFLRRCRG